MDVRDVMQDIARVDAVAQLTFQNDLYCRPDHVPRLALAEGIHHVRQAETSC